MPRPAAGDEPFWSVDATALREWVDAAIIVAIVVGSALLGCVQERRA